MGSRQIVLVSTAGISVLNAGIFWREAKTKRLFSQCYGARKSEKTVLKWHFPVLITGTGMERKAVAVASIGTTGIAVVRITTGVVARIRMIAVAVAEVRAA